MGRDRVNHADMVRPSRLFNTLANLYFRFGALALSVVFAAICVTVALNLDWSHRNVKNWVVVKGFGQGSKFTSYDSYEGLNTLLIALIIGLVAGLIAYAVKAKQAVDFPENGRKLRYGSTRRKIVFAASLFLGFIGLDRILMRCYVLGVLKLILFCSMGIIFFDGISRGDPMLLLISFILLAIITLWWTFDLVLILGGCAKEKTDACRYQPGSWAGKISRVMSLLAGYTGIDRLLMTRPWYGIVKFLLFVLSIGILEEATRKPNYFFYPFISCMIVCLGWWLSDIWTIRNVMPGTHTAKWYLR